MTAFVTVTYFAATAWEFGMSSITVITRIRIGLRIQYGMRLYA